MRLTQVRYAIPVMTVALCLTGCSIWIGEPDDGGGGSTPTPTPGGGGGGGTVTATLDTAEGRFAIVRDASTDEAEVTVTFYNDSGRIVRLAGGQSVAVNGETLTGPTAAGSYVHTIVADTQYTIEINEPTRGRQETLVTPPGRFRIEYPDDDQEVSLSGFELQWSNATSGYEVEVEVLQTIFGQLRREVFSELADTGSLGLSSQELDAFQQGADLAITINKIDEHFGVNGLATGVVTMEVSRSTIATPGP